MNHHDEFESRLRTALQDAEGRHDGPSPGTDAAVLAYAADRAPKSASVSRTTTRRRPSISRKKVPAQWIATAAVAAIAILLRTSAPTIDANDFNADGRVDVLDVFALARGLQSGDTPEGADVDGDGAIDQRDVDAMMRRLVQLEGGAS